MESRVKTLMESLHVSGSIASVAGIAILIIEKSTDKIDLGYIIAYLLSGVLILSVISLSTGTCKWIFYKRLNQLEPSFKIGFSIIMIIFFLVLLLLLIRLIFALFTPLVVLLINGNV